MIDVKKNLFLLIPLLFLMEMAYAQKKIIGNVVDSASLAPIPGVNIRIKNTYQGTSTDGKGFFRISITPTDTLIFSFIGYKMEEFAPTDLQEETIIVRLTQQPKLLDAVTVIAKSLQGTNSTPVHLRSNAKLMNYGPYGAGFSLSYFSKEEKEKRKLAKVIAEQDRVRNYLLVVCSPDIKQRFMEELSITEEEYYKILVKFNEQSTSNLYDLTPEELIVVFSAFYQGHVFKK
jgi:hypothetical protein